jgi:hypothetical protein
MSGLTQSLEFYDKHGKRLSADQRYFAIIEDAAYGAPPLTIQAEPNSGTYGARVLSFAAEARPLTYQVKYGNPSQGTTVYYAARKALMDFFTIWNAPFRVVKTLPNARQYQLSDVYPEPGITLESESTASGDGIIVTGLTLTAYNPIWRAVSATTVQVASFEQTQMSYPKEYEAYYENIGTGDLTPIVYAGNWPSYPTIRLYAPFSSATLTNQFGNVIAFYAGAATDRIVSFDPYSGFSVVDPAGANCIGELTINSTFEGFAMFPGETYQLGFTVSGASSTTLDFTYYERFIGL